MKLKEILEPEIPKIPTKEMKTIAYERLQPPPEPRIEEALPEDFDDFIDYIAHSSEFERFLYLIWKRKTHRGKSVNLKRELEKEYKARFGDVINEFKGLLKKREERLNSQQ